MGEDPQHTLDSEAFDGTSPEDQHTLEAEALDGTSSEDQQQGTLQVHPRCRAACRQGTA